MTGTRALITFSDPNSGKLVLLPYVLDPTDKLQKSPLHSRPLDIGLISSSAALYGDKMATNSIQNDDAVQICATVKLVPNKTKIHHVCYRGFYAQGNSLTIHPTTSNYLSSVAAFDVLCGSAATQHNNVNILKLVHGIINAISYGLVLSCNSALLAPHTGSRAYLVLRSLRDPMSAFCLGTVGFAIGLRLGEMSPGVTYGIHRKLGFAALTLGALQTLALLFRPKTTHKFRKYWKSYHHFVGYASVVLGVLNVFQGLEIMGESRSYSKLGYFLCLSTLIGVRIALEVNSWEILCWKSIVEKMGKRLILGSEKASGIHSGNHS